MKKFKKYSLLGFILLFAIVLSSCTESEKKEAKQEVQYTCPMHPQIIKNQPGLCPICNMDLVKIDHQHPEKIGLTLNESQIELANIKTIKIGSQNFEAVKRLNASLVANPENSFSISSKFAGRIDKLYIKEAGIQLQKHQALYKIYSEELLSLQKEYLLQIKQQKAFPTEKIYQDLKNSTINKLKLYGYSSQEILQLANSNQTNPYITVYAPESGIVTEINIGEGDYVNEGMTVLKLENLATIWVQADAYPGEVEQLKIGNPIEVEVAGFQNKNIQAKITYLNPQFNVGTQLINIRASISNADAKFIPGMQANILLPYAVQKGVMVLPNQAVLRTENGAHVWIKTNKNTFELRMVTLAQENDESVVIKSGLKLEDEVVISGAYLLNSEYKLKKGSNAMADMKM